MRGRTRATEQRHQSTTRSLGRGGKHDHIQPDLIRAFRPEEIDLDDLAEAIRQLLHSESTPTPHSSAGVGPDLLLVRDRATHVMGKQCPNAKES